MNPIPPELLYARSHEWVRIEGDTAEIGITDHAQQALGDIVYVELPAMDDEIETDDEFGTIESVKAVSSLYMPLAGTVTDVNTQLTDSPETVNEDCYDEGWLIRIQITDKKDVESLLSAEEYEQTL